MARLFKITFTTSLLAALAIAVPAPAPAPEAAPGEVWPRLDNWLVKFGSFSDKGCGTYIEQHSPKTPNYCQQFKDGTMSLQVNAQADGCRLSVYTDDNCQDNEHPSNGYTSIGDCHDVPQYFSYQVICGY